MELRNLWKIICRRKWIALITFFIFFVTVVIVTHLATPVYEAKAKVLVESSDTLSSLKSTLGLTAQNVQTTTSDQDEIFDTEIALVTIKPSLEKLISDLNLKDKHGKRLKPENLVKWSLLNKILARPYVEAEQHESSDLIEITSGSPNSVEATKMSNELAAFYIDNRVDYVKKECEAIHTFLENQIKDIKEKYYMSLSEKKDFMVRELTVDLQKETDDLLDYISDLKNDYKSNEIGIAQSGESIILIEKKIGGKEYASSDLINSLESKLNDLLVDVSGMGVDFTAEHPDVLQLNRKIDTIKNTLKERAEIVLNDTEVSIGPIYEELIKNLKDAYISKKVGELKRDLLKRYIDKAQNDLMKIPSKSTRQAQIELPLSANQDVYKKLLEYLTQVGVAETMTLSNIKLVEPATEPDKPDFPNKALNYVIGIFLGLFWGVASALFTEYIDNTIKSPEDIKHVKSLTFLGAVTRARQLANINTISGLDPTSPIVEAYRTIRNNLRYASADKPIKALVITSSLNGEGKSSVTSNIALTFSTEDKRVILVDLDLRRPALHKFFHTPNEKGVANVLAEGLPLNKSIIQTGIKGVDLLPSGPVPPDPGRLVELQKVRELIEILKGMYDIVVIDTPPVMSVNDAIIVGAAADGVVYVIESGKITASMVEDVRELMAKAGLRLVGVILNKIRMHEFPCYPSYHKNL